LKRKKKGFFIF